MFTSDVPVPPAVQQDSTAKPSPISIEEFLSPDDKLILYAALQNIASELRRIRRERQKNQQAK